MTALSIALVVSVAMLCGTRLVARKWDRDDALGRRNHQDISTLQTRVREMAAWMDVCEAKLRDVDEVKATLARKEVWK